MNSLKLTSWPLILTAVLFIPARLVTAQRQWEFGHSSNYRHRDNWVSRRLPCPHDSASLPRAESPNLIGLSRPLLVQRKLLLPAEGETALILFDGAGLKAFDETSASGSAGSNSEDQKRCSSDDRIRDAAYNLTEPLDWFRPDNWARSQSQREFFDALPVDRLPGPCDSVRFKDDATYFVKMLGRGETVTVGQLEICGRTFTGGESNDDSSKRLQDFWRQSPLAKRQFLWSSGEDSDDPPFSLGLFGSGDSRDCEVPLPVQSASLMSRVCSGLVNAEAAPCSNPIPAAEVSGACTDLCGSVALLIRSETISLKKLLNQLLKALQDKPASLRLSAFRTSRIEPTYQLVLRIRRHASDGGGSADAGKLSVIKALRWLESN
uniref:Protein amnionless n=1 Tax=Macrostomum lignano TaxID=282301 RepID=A0A1I8IAN1_9PLAT